MQKFTAFFKLDDFVPDLRTEFEKQSFNLEKAILVAVQVQDLEKNKTILPAGTDRRKLCVSQGENLCIWKTDSLRALFRGNKQPPVLGAYPEHYNDSFALLDLHALEISKFFGDRRDTEMKEIYSMLRRRPDGKSLGFVHDYMWQAAAWVLGTRPLSQAEFEAIMARLERSARTFELGPASRNYIAALRMTIDPMTAPV